MNASKLKIYQFPCRQDNYGVILHDPQSGTTISIDAPETEAVGDVLESKGLKLTHILTTHHHGDHVEGNEALKSEYGCTIIGPAEEAAKIPGLDQSYGHGDTFDIAGHRIEVIGTPGHTLGQIAYYLPDQGVVFCADALFALGCGRIFEGTPEMMFTALERLAALPAETLVYAGHEYTLANAKFALSVDPDNSQLADRAREIEVMRDNGKPTLPTTLELELQTNPFLRADDPAIRKFLGMESHSDLDVFTEIRARKDRF
ncbi:MAG: hydroxyacylglutathione hydrolase [Rhizobiaceae bacterium]|nr:hydroxyacylglutathione hydrolase [Rhizobiaceae bacterium]